MKSPFTPASLTTFPILLLTVLFIGAAPARGEVKDHKTIIPPDGQCYHGMAISMYETFDQDYKEFQDATGKKVAVLHWFTTALNKQGKPLDWAGQQRKFMKRCKTLGAVPCINYVFKSDNGIFSGFDAYTRGKMDKQLKGMAELFKEYQDPILLAINHEMNGNWYPWSAVRKHKDEESAVAGKADAEVGDSKRTPEETYKGYIASWRYIHDFLRRAGCKNVAFCFVPGAGATADNKKNLPHWKNYYPGDEYVDWLGFDTYNNCTPEALEKLTVELEALAKGKPLLIKEWGTSAGRGKAYLGGGGKNYPGDAAWLNAFFGLIERHPSIKSIAYFHRGKDYKITRPGGEETLKTYREWIGKERFITKSVAAPQ